MLIDLKTIVSGSVVHAYLVLINCVVVNKGKESVDDKPANHCCQLSILFSRSFASLKF